MKRTDSLEARRFRERVVWITGASSGIGRALALAFGRAGARLVLSARRREALEETARAAAPAETRLVPFDIARLPDLPARAAEALHCFGRVDLMVHNAGIAIRDRAANLGLDVHQRVLDTNYLGPVVLTQALLPSMIARRAGQFVVISSLSGKYGGPLLAAYAASKHALHGYFETLRGEEREHGITVTIVIPGFIRTEITAHALTGTGQPFGKVLPMYREAMTADRCAARILRAVARHKKEVLVGGMEMSTVYLQRWLPGLLSRLVWGHPVKLRNRLRRLIPFRQPEAGDLPSPPAGR